MANEHNRIEKRDMLEALAPAELAIVQFQPPTASLISQADPNTPPPTPNLEKIQQEIAEKSAQERTDALFDFLVSLITQTCKDEISRQSIVAVISSLQQDISTINSILSKHNLI